MATSDEECDDLTTCSVCYNKYDNSEHRPKFLPCAHTFCLICIKTLSSTSFYLTCPLCKRRLKVANKELDAEAFPNNRFALELIKLTSERKVQNCWCVSCGTEAKASCDGVHTIIDIKEEVEAMKGQTKEVINNLVEAIGKRQEVQQTLQVKLDDLKLKVQLTEIQMNNNEKHLKNLDVHLGECKKMTHLNPGKKPVLTILNKLENSLSSAKKELELANDLHSKEIVKDAVKQKASTSGFSGNRRKRARTLGGAEHVASVAVVGSRSTTTTTARSSASSINENASQSHGGESSNIPATNQLQSRSELSQTITPVVKNCPGANIGDEIVGVAFNPIKPLLACVLQTGVVAAFSSENYSNPFSSWNSKIYNTIVDFPNSKVIGWNASGTHLAVGTRLLTGLVVVLSDDGLQTVNIQGPTEMTSVMSLLRWNPSSPHYFVAACGGLALLANIIEGRCTQEYSFHTRDIMGMDWISEQVFATCSVDGNIYFFEIGQENPIRTLDCGGSVNSICWDSGMNLLSSCDSEGIIKLWSMASEEDQPQKQLDALGPVKYMEWSSAPPPLEGSLLASCPVAGSVSVWDTRTYTLVTPNLSGQASRLSFSPNGKYLFIAASTETEQFFKVWTTNTWEAIYFGNWTTCSPIPKVSWCPSSKKLVLKGDRDQVIVIELE